MTASTTAFQVARRIPEPQRQALLVGDDLLERLAEIELEIRPFGPAEMGHAQHVRHRQERMVAADDRLLLVDVDGGIAGPALAQRVQQRARRDQLGARGVDDQRGRLHAGEIVRADDAARLACQPHMKRQHVGALEQLLLACGGRVSGGGGLLARALLAPDQDLHAQPAPALGDQLADGAEPENAERRSAQPMRQGAGPVPAPHALGFERHVAARRRRSTRA